MNARVNKDMVSSKADLTIIQVFGEDNAFGSSIDICRRRDNTRRLTTKFKHRGREMLRRRRSNNLGNLHRASVEDVIETTFQDHACLLGSAGHHANSLLVEILWNQSRQQILSGHDGFSRFDHRTAACRDGGDQWTQREDDGEIPCSKNEGHSERFLPNTR